MPNIARLTAACVAAAVLVWPRPAAAQRYTDPDSPAVAAAARAALANAHVVDIVGVPRGVEGILRDLDAKTVGQDIHIMLAADVLFDFDKSDLRPEAADTLQKVAVVLAEYQTSPVLIEGHTDAKGTDAYNQALSERRADSVKQWLVRDGVEGSRLTTRGWGRMKPVAPNTKPDGSDDPDGRQKNRRVEITVKRAG